MPASPQCRIIFGDIIEFPSASLRIGQFAHSQLPGWRRWVVATAAVVINRAVPTISKYSFHVLTVHWRWLCQGAAMLTPSMGFLFDATASISRAWMPRCFKDGGNNINDVAGGATDSAGIVDMAGPGNGHSLPCAAENATPPPPVPFSRRRPSNALTIAPPYAGKSSELPNHHNATGRGPLLRQRPAD